MYQRSIRGTWAASGIWWMLIGLWSSWYCDHAMYLSLAMTFPAVQTAGLSCLQLTKF